MLIYASAFAAMLLTTCLRGFQNKNVAAGYKKLAFICGAAMTGLEGVVILLVAHSGVEALPFTALGSGLGWVVGMWAHDRLMKRRRKAEKAAKKTKRREQLEALVDERLRERSLM
jgi:hypothetical protein